MLHPRLRQNYLRPLLLVLAVFLLSWLFYSCFAPGQKIFLAKKDLLAVEWPSELDFTGERVPLDDFYVREAWEKDFLVELSQDYQNILYLKRAPKYFPLIEAELKKRGLPEDLKYIAVAESGLLEDSTSFAGAAGIWQFIPETARRYGLIVNDTVDERRNFEKATSAALEYLKNVHDKLGGWTLAAAGYNAGENLILSQLSSQKVEQFYDLFLNKETSRYIFRILAIREIMRDPQKYGYDLKTEDYFSWPKFEIKTVGKVDDLSAWAVDNGTTLRAIKELNPWIITRKLPEGEWLVKVLKQ